MPSIPIGAACDTLMETLSLEKGASETYDLFKGIILRMQQRAMHVNTARAGKDYLRHIYGRKGPPQDEVEDLVLDYIDQGEPWESILDSLKRSLAKIQR